MTQALADVALLPALPIGADQGSQSIGIASALAVLQSGPGVSSSPPMNGGTASAVLVPPARGAELDFLSDFLSAGQGAGVGAGGPSILAAAPPSAGPLPTPMGGPHDAALAPPGGAAMDGEPASPASGSEDGGPAMPSQVELGAALSSARPLFEPVQVNGHHDSTLVPPGGAGTGSGEDEPLTLEQSAGGRAAMLDELAAAIIFSRPRGPFDGFQVAAPPSSPSVAATAAGDLLDWAPAVALPGGVFSVVLSAAAAAPGQAAPGQAAPGQAAPGQAAPGQAAPGPVVEWADDGAAPVGPLPATTAVVMAGEQSGSRRVKFSHKGTRHIPILTVAEKEAVAAEKDAEAAEKEAAAAQRVAARGGGGALAAQWATEAAQKAEAAAERAAAARRAVEAEKAAAAARRAAIEAERAAAAAAAAASGDSGQVGQDQRDVDSESEVGSIGSDKIGRERVERFPAGSSRGSSDAGSVTSDPEADRKWRAILEKRMQSRVASAATTGGSGAASAPAAAGAQGSGGAAASVRALSAPVSPGSSVGSPASSQQRVDLIHVDFEATVRERRRAMAESQRWDRSIQLLLSLGALIVAVGLAAAVSRRMRGWLTNWRQ
jgi:hypothetical protein